MPGYPRMRDFPEALVKILLTIMEKTPDGGATMEDLKDAYQETRGSTPSNKTIYRSIRRLRKVEFEELWALQWKCWNHNGCGVFGRQCGEEK